MKNRVKTPQKRGKWGLFFVKNQWKLAKIVKMRENKAKLPPKTVKVRVKLDKKPVENNKKYRVNQGIKRKRKINLKKQEKWVISLKDLEGKSKKYGKVSKLGFY